MSIDGGTLKYVRVGLKMGMGPTPTQLSSGSFSRRTHSPFFSSQPAGLDDGLGSAKAGEADEQSNRKGDNVLVVRDRRADHFSSPD